jgi:nicotinamide riboside transporter PnuC
MMATAAKSNKTNKSQSEQLYWDRYESILKICSTSVQNKQYTEVYNIIVLLIIYTTTGEKEILYILKILLQYFNFKIFEKEYRKHFNYNKVFEDFLKTYEKDIPQKIKLLFAIQ